MAKLMCRTNPEIEPGSPSLQADSLSSEQPGKPNIGMQVCWGPAPADPGYSKERRRRRPIYLNIYQRYKE